jgi:hypothetical protein
MGKQQRQQQMIVTWTTGHWSRWLRGCDAAQDGVAQQQQPQQLRLVMMMVLLEAAQQLH